MTAADEARRDRLLNERDTVRAKLSACEIANQAFGSIRSARNVKRAESELRLINAALEEEGVFD